MDNLFSLGGKQAIFYNDGYSNWYEVNFLTSVMRMRKSSYNYYGPVLTVPISILSFAFYLHKQLRQYHSDHNKKKVP